MISLSWNQTHFASPSSGLGSSSTSTHQCIGSPRAGVSQTPRMCSERSQRFKKEIAPFPSIPSQVCDSERSSLVGQASRKIFVAPASMRAPITHMKNGSLSPRCLSTGPGVGSSIKIENHGTFGAKAEIPPESSKSPVKADMARASSDWEDCRCDRLAFSSCSHTSLAIPMVRKVGQSFRLGGSSSTNMQSPRNESAVAKNSSPSSGTNFASLSAEREVAKAQQIESERSQASLENSALGPASGGLLSYVSNSIKRTQDETSSARTEDAQVPQKDLERLQSRGKGAEAGDAQTPQRDPESSQTHGKAAVSSRAPQGFDVAHSRSASHPIPYTPRRSLSPQASYIVPLIRQQGTGHSTTGRNHGTVALARCSPQLSRSQPPRPENEPAIQIPASGIGKSVISKLDSGSVRIPLESLCRRLQHDTKSAKADAQSKMSGESKLLSTKEYLLAWDTPESYKTCANLASFMLSKKNQDERITADSGSSPEDERTTSDSACSSVMHQCGLKLVVFDFDCTLTSFHVFASLAGVINSTARKLMVPPPHARTENGQVKRLCELDSDPKWGPGAFALEAFGGSHRLEQLRCLLKTLRSNNVECLVLSRGMVQTIRKCLAQVSLLSFFSHIIGSEGCAMGYTAYDHSLEESSAGEFQGVMKTKLDKLRRLIEDRNLQFDQVVFVDDELAEIDGAKNICKTIHVSSGFGVQEQEMKLLRTMLDRVDSSDIGSE